MEAGDGMITSKEPIANETVCVLLVLVRPERLWVPEEPMNTFSEPAGEM